MVVKLQQWLIMGCNCTFLTTYPSRCCCIEQIHILLLFQAYSLIREMDAFQNGVTYHDEPRYPVTTDLSKKISGMNPHWNETQTPEVFDERFLLAMKLAQEEIVDRIKYFGNVWWPARRVVCGAIGARRQVHPDGRVVVIYSKGTDVPVRDILPWAEKKNGITEKEEHVLVVVQKGTAIFTWGNTQQVKKWSELFLLLSLLLLLLSLLLLLLLVVVVGKKYAP